MFRLFKPKISAPVARDRLKVLLAHERALGGRSDLINVLREEILQVISKHVAIEPDSVRVKADRSDKVSVLTVDIEIPFETTRVAA